MADKLDEGHIKTGDGELTEALEREECMLETDEGLRVKDSRKDSNERSEVKEHTWFPSFLFFIVNSQLFANLHV